MVEKAVAELGRLDLLVNNAGTPGTRRRITPPELDLMTEDLWSTLLETNLLGVFRCAKAAAPALKQASGAIVNTASIAGLGRAGSSLAYSATKAGVVSLTQNLARALAPEVRVNAIAPGAVDSSWMVEWTNEERQQSIERALLKRRCQPEDLAEVILFLGFGAAMVTGQTVTVDGGLTLWNEQARALDPAFRLSVVDQNVRTTSDPMVNCVIVLVAVEGLGAAQIGVPADFRTDHQAGYGRRQSRWLVGHAERQRTISRCMALPR